MFSWSIAAVLLASVLPLLGCYAAQYRQPQSFAVEIPGGPQTAEELARKYGFCNRGKIGNIDDVYLFEALPSSSHQRNRQRGRGHGFTDQGNTTTTLMEQQLKQEPCVQYVEHQKPRRRVKRRYSPPTDPRWGMQWSLLNTGQVGGRSAGHDLNVEPVWIQGITGRGVTVAVVDDGISYSHPDLRLNFDAEASYDFVDNDVDVMPVFSGGQREAHGTSCAGEIAMGKDNGVCGVGVAYEAKIAGLRLLSGTTTDAKEANALGYKMNDIHIYSNSWGPVDNGILVEGPGPLLKAVLANGVKRGRSGKGSIYVWAAGNGGNKNDSCATDGYASSIYTIAVGAVDQFGHQAYYDETCTSKMAVTFTHNKHTQRRNQTTTTNADGTCRDDFVGTSAACPMVTGAIALALQANPTLTWRDIQYLIAYTSNDEPLINLDYWTENGGGLRFSDSFGFGVVDAEALVTRARNWINVPEQQAYTFHPPITTGNATSGHPVIIRFRINREDTDIRFLEHVVVEVSLSLEGFSQRYDYSNYTEVSDFLGNPYDRTEFERIVNHRGARRGDVSISLLSPHRTRSILLPYRTRDFINTEGFSSWPFMSVIHWSEDPQGLWSLLVSYRSLTGYVSVTNLTVTMYGTTAIPEAVRRIPSECDVGCRGRCAAAGPTFCDSCRNFRNASTLECVDSCADGLEIHNGYCIDPLANNTYRYMPQSFSCPNVVDNTTNTTNGTGFLNRTLSLATSSLTRLSSLTSHPAPTTEPSVSSTMFSVTPSLTTGSRHVMTTMGVSPTPSLRPPLVLTSLLPSEAPSIHSASATSTVVVPTPTLSVSSALHAQTHWLLSLMCLCTVFVVLQLY